MNAVLHPPVHASEQVADPATDRTWAVLTHLSGLSGYLPIVPVLGNVAVPLVIWLTKGKSDPEVEAHARAALNFQVTVLVAALVATVLVFVAVGLVLLPLVALAHVVLTIVGAVKASKGELLDYPFSLPWVRARA